MKNGGSIVNTSSAGGDMPAPTLSVYAMTKAAVMMITRCAATEPGEFGIRVNAVAPGFIDTPMVQRQLDQAGRHGRRGRARRAARRSGPSQRPIAGDRPPRGS